MLSKTIHMLVSICVLNFILIPNLMAEQAPNKNQNSSKLVQTYVDLIEKVKEDSIALNQLADKQNKNIALYSRLNRNLTKDDLQSTESKIIQRCQNIKVNTYKLIEDLNDNDTILLRALSKFCTRFINAQPPDFPKLEDRQDTLKKMIMSSQFFSQPGTLGQPSYAKYLEQKISDHILDQSSKNPDGSNNEPTLVKKGVVTRFHTQLLLSPKRTGSK